MTKRIFYECDGCGKNMLTEDVVQRIWFITGRSIDCSGHGYTNDYKIMDLCPDCMKIVTEEKDIQLISADIESSKEAIRKLKENKNNE